MKRQFQPKSARAAATARAGKPHRVVMVGYPDAQVLDITGPLEVFARTSRWLRDHRRIIDAYRIELVGLSPGDFATSSGLTLRAERSYAEVRSADTLLIAGGIGYRDALKDAQLLRWLARQSGKVQRLGSICTGAVLLAAAGLLAGRRATTHWAYFDQLLAVEPRVELDRDAIFTRSDFIYTSAGVTAGMDLALAMVESDWGKATALSVAQELVMYLKRPGGQSQFSRHLEAERRDDEFGALELWILDHLDADLSVAALAQRASMSPRHFARVFRERLGTTPAAYVRRLRVEEARRRIEGGAPRVKRVARDCGFSDEQQLRRAYKRVLGVTPAEYGERFR